MDNPSTTVVGLDVSDRWTHVFRTKHGCPDEGERSKIRTRKSPLEEYFRSLPPVSTIILEVGPHSRWIYHLALECGMGHEIIVANARKLRFIYAGTCKTDQLDAEALARVGCLQPQLLHPVHHRSAAAQEDLNVLLARDTLIQVRTKLINTVRGLIKASGREPLASVDTAHFVRRHGAFLVGLGQEHYTCLVRTLEETQAQIEELDRRLIVLADSYPATEVLRQVFGVGPITALAFILVIEDPDRFHSTRKVGAYLGLVPKIDQSGEVNPKLGITKAGHPMLRRLLVQCAHRIMRTDGPDTSLQRHGHKIRARKDKGASKRAAVAVARKLSVVLLTLWKTGEVYDPLRQAA